MIIHKTNMKGYDELTVVKEIDSSSDFEKDIFIISGTEEKSGVETKVVLSIEEVEAICDSMDFFLNQLRDVDLLIENQQEG